MGRNELYFSVFNLGLDNFIFGSGLGGSYSVAQIPPHNFFLFIFADFGILFTVGLICLLVRSFIKLYRFKYILICGCRLNTILLSMLISFPIFSSMSSGNEQRKAVWVLLGLVFVTIKLSRIKILESKKNCSVSIGGEK